jgi:hypothetical protein
MIKVQDACPIKIVKLTDDGSQFTTASRPRKKTPSLARIPSGKHAIDPSFQSHSDKTPACSTASSANQKARIISETRL